MIKTSYKDNMKISIKVGDFDINTDLPAAHNGDNTAANPFDLFLASFAGCNAVYALFYLNKHGIKKDNISISLSPEYTKEGMVSSAKILVSIPKDFPPEHESGLKAMVNQCKVGKHLKFPHEVIIEKQ